MELKTHEKNMLVNSGAGTGKTTFMKEAIRGYLKEEGNKQDQVLGITFTNKAGRHMRSGLSEYEDIEISSLHKYFLPRVEYKDIIPDDIMKELEKETLKSMNSRLASLNAKVNSSDFYKYLNSWQTYCVMQVLELPKEEKGKQGYSNVRKILSSTGSLKLYVKSKAKDDPVLAKYYSIIIDELVRLISYIYDLNYVTFTDIIIQGIFYTDKNIKYTLIDEFQDLTYLEFLSIITISKESKFLILLDEYQGIYQWRQSSLVYNLKQLCVQLPDLEIKKLQTNYRCSKAVHRLASNFTGEKNISGYRDIEGKIEILDSKNSLETILRMVGESQARGEETAILCQTNQECSAVANYLKVNLVKNIDHKVRNFNSECDPVRLFIKSLDYFTKNYSTPKLKALLSDKYFSAKKSRNIVDSLTLQKDITAEQIALGGLSMQNLKSLEPYEREGFYYTVFDTECTGINPYEDDIIQIAATKIDVDFNVVDRFEVYLKTDKFTQEAFEVHKITEEFLEENAIDSRAAINSFNDFLAGTILVGHNVGFDTTIFETHCIRYGVQPKIGYVIDTLDLSRTLLKNRVSYRLEDLNEGLGLGANPNHNALEDVEATVRLFKYLSRSMVGKGRVPEDTQRYYVETITEVNEWWDPDLLNFYNNIESKFRLDTNGTIFSILFKETLAKLIDQNLSYKQISDFFTLDDSIEDGKSSVTISTVHQSKGLEYDNVIFIQTINSSTKVLGKERSNVEYVTITRARDNFYIVPKCRYSNIREAILNDKLAESKRSGKEGISSFSTNTKES